MIMLFFFWNLKKLFERQRCRDRQRMRERAGPSSADSALRILSLQLLGLGLIHWFTLPSVINDQRWTRPKLAAWNSILVPLLDDRGPFLWPSSAALPGALQESYLESGTTRTQPGIPIEDAALAVSSFNIHCHGAGPYKRIELRARVRNLMQAFQYMIGAIGVS